MALILRVIITMDHGHDINESAVGLKVAIADVVHVDFYVISWLNTE